MLAKRSFKIHKMTQIKFQSQDQITEQFEHHILIKSQLGFISYGMPTKHYYQIVPDEPVMIDYYEKLKNNAHTHLIGSSQRMAALRKALAIDFFGIAGNYEEDCYEFSDAKLYRGQQDSGKSIEELVTFHAFDESSQVTIETKKVNVIIEKMGEKYVIYQNGIHLTDVQFKITLKQAVRAPLSEPQGPDFGVTHLRQQHLVLWINSRPILLDPPEQLIFTGSVMLTSRNDKGVFDLLIHSKNVEVITTPKIMRQFLEKYKALTAYRHLQDLVHFRAVRLEGVQTLFGANFRFTYNQELQLDFEIALNGKTLKFVHDMNQLKELSQQTVLLPQSNKKLYLKKLFILEQAFSRINLEDLKWILDSVVLESYDENEYITNTNKLYLLVSGDARRMEGETESAMYPGEWMICKEASIQVGTEASFYTLEEHDVEFIFGRKHSYLVGHRWHPFQILFRNAEFQRLDEKAKEAVLARVHPEETLEEGTTLKASGYDYVVVSGCLEHNHSLVREQGAIVRAEGYCKIRARERSVVYRLAR